MKSTALYTTAIAFFTLLAIPAGFAAQDIQTSHSKNPPHYQLTVLPTLGGSDATATGINNEGDVVGGSGLPGNNSGAAVLWRRNKPIDLGNLDNGTASYTFTNPNETDEVSGFRTLPPPTRTEKIFVCSVISTSASDSCGNVAS